VYRCDCSKRALAYRNAKENARPSGPRRYAYMRVNYAPAFFSILAHVSFSGSVRLNTSAGLRIQIDAEVANALELVAFSTFALASDGSSFASTNNLQRVRIQPLIKSSPSSNWLGSALVKSFFVDANLRSIAWPPETQ